MCHPLGEDFCLAKRKDNECRCIQGAGRTWDGGRKSDVLFLFLSSMFDAFRRILANHSDNRENHNEFFYQFFVVFFSPNFSIAKTICTNFIHVHHPRYPGGMVLAPGCIFKGVVRLSSLILILRKSKGTLRAGVDDMQASRNFPQTVSNNSGHVNREV